MKKYLLLLGFVASIGFSAQAQNYAPFKAGRTPYFQAGDSIYSLRITNAYVQGTDSVFEFNPRMIPQTPTFMSAVRSGNNLFGFSMRKSASGNYRFVFLPADTIFSFGDSDTLLLKPNAPVGHSWTFSSSLQLTATLLSRQATTVLGQPDSTLTISISNGDTIKISRKLGLVKTRSFYSYFSPASVSQPLTLVQLFADGSGTAFHHPFAIFDFQPGDKFLYEGVVSIGFPPCYRYWETHEVLSRYQNADTIRYQIRRQDLKAGQPGWPCAMPLTGVLSAFDTISLVVTPTDYSYLLDLSNEFANRPNNHPWKNRHNLGHFVSSYNQRRATHFETLFLADSLTGLYQGIWDVQSRFRFAEGLGRVKFHQDQSRTEALIAYIKGTETYGNWQPLALINSTDELQANQKLQIFPNPFSAEITLRFPEAISEPTEISVFNLQGQRVHQQTVTDLPAQTGLKVQLPALPAGLYLLQLNQGGKTYSAKVQRQ